MNAIKNVFNAFANLAASLNALAGLIDTASGRLRQSLALDDVADTSHIIDHEPLAETNGRRGRKQSMAS